MSLHIEPDIDTVFVTEMISMVLRFQWSKKHHSFGRDMDSNIFKMQTGFKIKDPYWGDIDTHGFVILSQFRNCFHRCNHFRWTVILACLQPVLGKEEKPSEAIPKNLTNEEYSLYNALRSNLFGESVRLEQEFISFDRVCKLCGEIT